METREKLRYRGWLLALGAERWYDCTDRVERMKVVEILEEEFARAKAAGEPLEKERRFLANRGITISDVPVQVEVASSLKEQANIDLGQGNRVCRTLKNMYIQDPVHGDAALSTKAHEDTQVGPIEGMSRRLTTVDAQNGGLSHVEEAGEIYEHLDSRGWTGSWTWRGWSWNRVPPAIEFAVRERFAQGWSKSKLAREFRLNRRTVIRICGAKAKVDSLTQGEQAEIG